MRKNVGFAYLKGLLSHNPSPACLIGVINPVI